MKKILKKIVFLTICLLGFSLLVDAKHLYAEKEYQTYWCNKHNGIMEYELDDKTRIDCLLPTMAVEFDFAPKWAECIGQALYYGKKTERNSVCILIMENPQRDIKYLKRLYYTVNKRNNIPDFIFFTITPEDITK